MVFQIAAQLVMVRVALISSRKAETWGRKPILLIAFAVLPIRGLLSTLSVNPFDLIGVQLLDGISAGILGVVGVLIVADLTKGTGRFNLVQGAPATAIGLGSGLSHFITGYLGKLAGFDSGLIFLSAIALLALAFCMFTVSETLTPRPGARSLADLPDLP